MIDYVSGKIATLTPTQVVIDNNGIGYSAEISLRTYSSLEGKTEAVVYMVRQINARDGSQVDYGFATKEERALFELITSVSGMGAATARIILSSLSAEELQNAILGEDVGRLKSIKGIGSKSAQRMILELKDKIVKGAAGIVADSSISTATSAEVDEATSALLALGFSKPNISKALQAILKANPSATVEQLIKSALQIL